MYECDQNNYLLNTLASSVSSQASYIRPSCYCDLSSHQELKHAVNSICSRLASLACCFLSNASAQSAPRFCLPSSLVIFSFSLSMYPFFSSLVIGVLHLGDCIACLIVSNVHAQKTREQHLPTHTHAYTHAPSLVLSPELGAHSGSPPINLDHF